MDTAINNTEIFSLFKSLSELEDTTTSVIQKIFFKYKIDNKILFTQFRKNFAQNYSKLQSALLYAGYILKWHFNQDKDSPPMSTNIFNNYSISNFYFLFEYPYEIISIFYTCEYLQKKECYFKYTDYKDLRTTSKEMYKAVNTNLDADGIFYHANKEDKKISQILASKNRSNHTRNIAFAKDSIFLKSIHFRTDVQPIYPYKNGNVYYLNEFLPEFTFLLGEQTNMHKLRPESWYDGKQYHIPISSMCKSFLKIGTELYKEQDLHQKILNFYKLEYTFGIFSLSSYLYEMKARHFKTEEFSTHLLSLQEFPNVFSSYRLALLNALPDSSYVKKTAAISDSIVCIFSSKFIMCILNSIYDNDINKLLEDLKQLIETMYKNNNPDNFNDWHHMQRMLQFFDSKNKDIKEEMITFIDKELKKVNSTNQKQLEYYFQSRYTQKWYDHIQELFSLDIISML